jgi:hypothetical protein
MQKSINMTRAAFDSAIIAQSDDEDYQESGYVVFKNSSNIYHLCAYGHCSCYDTFTDLVGGGISDNPASGTITPEWSGTKEELIRLAKNDLDPTWASSGRPRKNNDADSDVDHLREVYAQVLKKFGVR